MNRSNVPLVKRLLSKLGCLIVGALIFALRSTCRFYPHDDPRPALKAAGGVHVYAILHAHQLAAVMGAERGCGAMVSRSADGDMLVPLFRMCGLVPVRGSGRSGRRGTEKGGVSALQALIRHVRGGQPATLAVDGPKGPRGHVHGGIALLSQKTGAPVATVVLVPKRRWTLKKTWDRMQIPMPFSRIDGYFGPLLSARDGETVDEFSLRIEMQLRSLEHQHDPDEAVFCQPTVTPSSLQADSQSIAA